MTAGPFRGGIGIPWKTRRFQVVKAGSYKVNQTFDIKGINRSIPLLEKSNVSEEHRWKMVLGYNSGVINNSRMRKCRLKIFMDHCVHQIIDSEDPKLRES